MEKIYFMVDGLTCEACAKIVKSRLLKRIEGISEVEVETTGKVTLSSNNPVSQSDIEGALEDTDFKFVSFK